MVKDVTCEETYHWVDGFFIKEAVLPFKQLLLLFPPMPRIVAQEGIVMMVTQHVVVMDLRVRLPIA